MHINSLAVAGGPARPMLCTKLRLLFLALAPPYPPTNGQRMRNFGLLTTLAKEGHDVDLISFATMHDVVEPELERTCRSVKLVPIPSDDAGIVSEAWRRLRGLPSPLPSGALHLRSAAMRAAVAAGLRGDRWDAVICDDVYNLGNIPSGSSVPVFLNKHDITHEIMERFLRYERNPLTKAYVRLECRKVRELERRSCAEVVQVLACSERDARELKRLCPEARISVLPNVIDVDAYPPTRTEDGSSTVLYFGAMDWYPNCDAVDFFTSKILPLIEKRVPEVKFVVAGRNPPEKFRKRYAAHTNVKFSGTVPDIRTEIAKAAVCVVPLRIGSGTRLKILEAAAMCKPVVSTRIGAEGLEFVDGEELVLADEAGEFASAVADLLADPARRCALGKAARRRVTKDYSFAALSVHMRHALAAVTATHSTEN